jgi:phage-related holin
MKPIIDKLIQYLLSIGGGFLLAVESAMVFLVPCLIAVLVDVYAAWCLGRRVHKKYPEKADGKFKSEYKNRIMATMILIFSAIICAHYIDILVLKGTDLAVRFTVGVFFFYEIFSILENWSSENDQPFAKVLQRMMVNKAERHFNVPLSDILLNEKKETNNEKNNEPDS